MKKTIKLTNEQAQSLYIFLANTKGVDQSKNRMRWKFLDELEENVFNYEAEQRKINEAAALSRKDGDLVNLEKLDKTINDLSKVFKTYTWTDREVFSQAKSIFELSYDPNFQGRQSKMYKEVEDAFMDVKETE